MRSEDSTLTRLWSGLPFPEMQHCNECAQQCALRGEAGGCEERVMRCEALLVRLALGRPKKAASITGWLVCLYL